MSQALPWRERAGVAAIAIGAAMLAYALRAPLPDDYDAIGFLHALTDFDLSKLQPHFPGYPVYVALGRVAYRIARWMGGDTLGAAESVSSVAAGVTAAAAYLIARQTRGAMDDAAGIRAGVVAAALCTFAALPLKLGGSALSDATAAAFAMVGFLAVRGPAPRPIVAGVAIGLLVGTRLSSLPIALSLILLAVERRTDLARVLAAALAAALAWAVPLAIVVGPRALVSLGRTHVTGHFSTWGGSITTRPDLAERAGAFFRGVFSDGIAPHPLFLVAGIAFFLLVLFRLPRAKPSLAARSALRDAAIVTLSYALWVFLGQNLIAHPRHLLPIVLALLVALACAISDRPLLRVALVLCVAIGSLPAALDHHRLTPPEVQAAEYLKGLAPPSEIAVFGGPSIRFFQLFAPTLLSRERTWLSEVDVELERVDRLPSRVFITSEVDTGPADGDRARRLGPPIPFCPDHRYDRPERCLSLREYHLDSRTAP